MLHKNLPLQFRVAGSHKHQHQLQAQGRRDWSPPEGWQVEHEGLQAELFTGGVYLTLFMKNPQFPLRNPKASLEVAVLDRTQPEWQPLSQTALSCTQLQTA